MDIWLLRHGSTEANVEGRFQGQLDYPLSEAGRREAKLLARRVSSAGLELLFSSDLQRAWETAQYIAAATGLKPIITPLLRECSWGVAEGLTVAELKSYCRPVPASGRFRIRAGQWGGESERKLLARARLFLKRTLEGYSGYDRVAVVSHARFINALLAAALGLKAWQHWPFAPAPASLSIISHKASPGRFRPEVFNDRCHLLGGSDLGSSQS